MKTALALLLSPLWLGCPSFSTLGSARTLNKGAREAMVSPAAYGQPKGPAPTIEGALRYGLADRFEVGGRLWLLGGQIESKVGLLRPDSAREGLNVSLFTSVGYFGLLSMPWPALGYGGSLGGGGGSSASTQALTASAGLLGGYRVGGHEITLGPRVLYAALFRGTESAEVTSVGGSLGVSVRILEWLRLVPEVSVLYPLRGDFALSEMHPGIASPGAPIFRAGIGVTFTREEAPQPPVPDPEET